MKALSAALLLLVMACGSSGNTNQTIGTVSVGGSNVTQSSSGNTDVSSGNTGGVSTASSGGDTSSAGTMATSTDGPGGTSSTGDTSTDPSMSLGGSQDFASSGGGSSMDVGSGGGSSVDVSTGGAVTIDIPTGGGSSIDVATGGGSSVDVITGGASSIDMRTGGGTSIDLATGGAPSIDLGCNSASPLNQINVFVTMDAAPSGADTEGNMYVGGNLTATGSYTVGAKDTLDCTRYSLVVGGNITIKGGSVNGGKAVYGGTTASVSGVSFACDGLTRGKGPVDLVALKATVEELSIRLSKLTSNGTVTSTSGKLTLTGTDKKLNIFNVTAAQLNAVTETVVNFPAASAVVVNVSGTDVVWGNGSVCLNGQCGDSDQATNVLWNFYEAATLYSTGMAIQGSVLAPFATLDGGGGHIAGQVIVRYLKGGLEYHPYYFDACLMWTSLV